MGKTPPPSAPPREQLFASQQPSEEPPPLPLDPVTAPPATATATAPAPATEPHPNAPAGAPPPTSTAVTAIEVVTMPLAKLQSIEAEISELRKQNPISFAPTDFHEILRLSRMLAYADLLPKELRGKPYNVMLIIAKGRELGFSALQSIGAIHIIDGKAEVGANAMIARVIASPPCEYFVLVETRPSHATWATRRKDWPTAVCSFCAKVFSDGTESAPPHRARRAETVCPGSGQPAVPFEMEFTYSMEDALTAGLYTKGRTEESKSRNNWVLQGPNMCRRRAGAMLCREAYPDIVHGTYDHGELTEMREVIDADGSVSMAEVPAEKPKPSTYKDRLKERSQKSRDPLDADLIKGVTDDVPPEFG